MGRKIILFELNEVPPRVIDEYCRWRPHSCLARLIGRCERFDTFAEDQGTLSPWITWPTLHRGVTNARHTIGEFGQDLREVNQEFPPVWEILASHGISTGVFGSLHSQHIPKNAEQYAFYLPDVFAAGGECFPRKLKPFQEFNLAMSRESGAVVSGKIHWASAVRMLASLPDLGLRFSTLAEGAGQIISERISPWRKIRRRTYQTVLAFDLFMKQLEKSKPQFSTFFTNHVASTLHRFWAATFPNDYAEFELSDEWVTQHRGEVDFTMGRFDRMLARLEQFAHRNPEYQIMIASSMGQAATEAKQHKHGMWITDVNQFMTGLGLHPHEWRAQPAMVPDVNVFVAPQSRELFTQAIENLRVGWAKPKLTACPNDFFSVLLGMYDVCEEDMPLSLFGTRRSWADFGITNQALQDSGQSANHVPHGTLLIFDPTTSAAVTSRAEMSTTEIVPKILRQFSVPVPGYMQRQGSRCSQHSSKVA